MDWDNLEIKSEQVQDILGQPPSWTSRYGNVVAFWACVLLILGAYLFKYPYILKAVVTLVSSNPPAPVMTYRDGTISYLAVSDSQIVQKGEWLGIIENPAKVTSVRSLDQLLENYPEIISLRRLQEMQQESNEWRLGELQPDFSAYLRDLQDFFDFQATRYYEKQIEGKRAKLQEYQAYISLLKHQHKLKESDYDLSLRQYGRDSLLFSREVLSDMEWENARRRLIERKVQVEGAAGKVAEVQVAVATLKEEILELDLEKERKTLEYKRQIREGCDNLKAKIDKWEQEYVLMAPIDGVVSLTRIWSTNQKVKKGETVITIIPKQERRLVGKVVLPIKGSGKVKKGQTVNVLLDNYPYMEYGMLKGRVETVSLVPEEMGYIVEIDLPDTLVTSYGIHIPFRQNLKGEVQIITEDYRFLERILYPLKYLFNSHF